MIELESARLRIREITADDLEIVLPVYESNPNVMQHMEGSEGEVGRYNLERWQRDWYIAQLMPGRHMLGCYLREDGEAVGFIDYLEEHDDGKPFLGQLMIHKAYQRQGLGSEAFQCLTEHFHKDYGWPLLRTWVLEENGPGLAFLQRVGFQPIEQASGQWRLPGGLQQYIMLERSLSE